MFTLVYGDDLYNFQGLSNQMFQDRRSQFKDDYGWDLTVDDSGRETDEYDLMNPLYLILRDAQGRHVGSTRLMPTTGPTMIADHFSHMTDGVEIESPLIWETTRFFIADRGANSARNAAALMWAGCAFGLRAGIEFYVGVTGAQMPRIFAACGWPADIIGEAQDPSGDIVACLWEVNQEIEDRLRKRARIEKGEHSLSVYRGPAKPGSDLPGAGVKTPIAAMSGADGLFLPAFA